MLPLLLSYALTFIAPDGDRLHEGRSCYTIYARQGAQEAPVGLVFQSLIRRQEGDKKLIDVVVHQRLNNGRFDMRDSYSLDAKTLRPLRFETTQNGQRHVTLRYNQNAVKGERRNPDGSRSAIDVPITQSVWEGNLFGLTFAALPLAAGTSFELPFYQYDRGLGTFTVNVVGSETVQTPAGPVDAWVLDAGPTASERLQYLVGKKDNSELGYRSPEGSQRLGGDCTNLE